MKILKKIFFFFFFEIGNFFFQIGKKSPKSHYERVRISAPEDTKKNPCVCLAKETIVFSHLLATTIIMINNN